MTDPHVSECQIRWVDMDAYRHVNNTVYLRYLEIARLEFLGFLIGFGEAPHKEPDVEENDGMVIAEMEIAYRRSLVFREQPVWVHSWITYLGTSSVRTRNLICDETGDYAVSTSRMVCIDRASTRPRPLRIHERAYLERYLLES